MSQKINIINFKLGINSWYSNYIENKTHELKNYSFNYLQIQKFLTLFFKKNKLELINLKTFYKKNNLNFFILYNIIGLNNILLIKNNFSIELKLLEIYYKKKISNFKIKNHFKLNINNFKNFKNYLQFLYVLAKKNKKYKTLFIVFYKFIKYSEKKTYFNYFFNFSNNVRKNLILKLFQFFKLNNRNFFIKKIIKTLQNFLKLKNLNVSLILKQFNVNNYFNFTTRQKLIIYILNLKKFKNYNFFKIGINLLFYGLKNSYKFAYLISNFLKNYLSKIQNFKSLNILLKFLFININFFLLIFKKIKGIEIKIKGNFTKNQKAVSKNIIVGKKISKLTISNNVNFNKSVAYSKKGTFGIKTWVYK